jgi:FkbM family methyltransferase
MYFAKKLHDNRFTRSLKQSSVRLAAANGQIRPAFNWYYSLLGAKARSNFHARYAKIFRDRNVSISSGTWNVDFLNHRIRLPLRPSWSWLDWDIALSLVGHDVEVVQTYAALIISDQRPALFMDIGANYGMHSILFLSTGIPVIAFEPNPSCAAHFDCICDLNGFSARWERVAVGHTFGEVELVYPDKETWLGSVSRHVVSQLERSGAVTKLRVPMKPLDHYLNDIPPGRILIKIDVEGHEREVLIGAAQVLRRRMPKIIFESSNRDGRDDLVRLLNEYGFDVHELPWSPSIYSRALVGNDFLISKAINFVAIPSLSGGMQ